MAHLILTAAEAEAMLPGGSGLEADALQLLLDAAAETIVVRYGEGGTVVERVDGGGTYAFLRQRASSIVSIVEHDGTTDTTLAVDDYRLRGDGVSLRRLSDGTNARTWFPEATVTYVAADDFGERARVQLALLQLMLTYMPGVTSERVGEWSQTLASNAVWNNSTEREAILDSMGTGYTGPGFA